MSTKLFGIKEKDFFQFIKKINDFYSKEDVFATQTHFVNEEYVAIIYFKSREKK